MRVCRGWLGILWKLITILLHNRAEVKQKKKKKKEKKAVLSFGDEDEDGTGSGASTPGESQQPPAKRTKLSKDPTVNTAFLPDREREEQERRMREELRQEWLKKQEEMKGESIEITFSYWDGSGHRKEVECKKGDTIAQFLDKAKGCFSELRSVSTDNLIYIVSRALPGVAQSSVADDTFPSFFFRKKI